MHGSGKLLHAGKVIGSSRVDEAVGIVVRGADNPVVGICVLLLVSEIIFDLAQLVCIGACVYDDLKMILVVYEVFAVNLYGEFLDILSALGIVEVIGDHRKELIHFIALENKGAVLSLKLLVSVEHLNALDAGGACAVVEVHGDLKILR